MLRILAALALFTPATACISASDESDDPGIEEEAEERADPTICSGVQVYQDSNLKGPSLTFCNGNFPDLREHSGGLKSSQQTWNDRISSAHPTCNSDRFVSFYKDVGYKGTAWTYQCTYTPTYDGSWNDESSSMRVGCRVYTECTSNSQCCSGKCLSYPYGAYCTKPVGQLVTTK